MRQTGIFSIALAPDVVQQRPVQRRERQLVGPQRPSERVCTQRSHEVGATGGEPCLRSAEQLVAGEEDQVRACRETLLRHRLVPDAELRRVQQRA